jgi:hypothetical protein
MPSIGEELDFFPAQISGYLISFVQVLQVLKPVKSPVPEKFGIEGNFVQACNHISYSIFYIPMTVKSGNRSVEFFERNPVSAFVSTIFDFAVANQFITVGIWIFVEKF